MQAEILCIWYGQRRDVVKQKLVRPSRFERLTPALGGRCSIQLSYGRTHRDRARDCDNSRWLNGSRSGVHAATTTDSCPCSFRVGVTRTSTS